MTADQLSGDFTVRDLKGCTVHLLGTLSALRLQRLRQCHVLCGPVAGASFLDGAALVLAHVHICPGAARHGCAEKQDVFLSSILHHQTWAWCQTMATYCS